ncbi:MAG: NAD(P)/FAD-dependent oxidoreductase [Amphritea sp.]|jgi:NADH dehydrogenase|nr:NAD(P)/FAD-dependent oxidoreductase [Amphritea sp.]
MKNIVIVGGGAGGLELATRLGHKYGKNKQANIILIDRNRTHIWKPLLHEVATGSLDINSDGVVYRAHSHAHYYQFQIGTMIDLDSQNKRITLSALLDDEGKEVLPERTQSFDILVLAVGSVSNDFGTPGVSENCFFLDSNKQAERFHQALINHFMRINQQSSKGELRLAIVGGGATGVELAAELYHVASLINIYGMPDMSAKRLKIDLIEGGPRILQALPERIAVKAKQELVKLGVSIHENVRVTQVDEKAVIADDLRIGADLIVWAAGVKAPSFIQDIDLFETNRSGQIVVKPTLQSTVDDSIYVIGDCCACQQQNGSWVPPRAQSAHQMAGLVYRNIIQNRQGEPLSEYVYKDHGSLVNLSKYSTVGSLMGNLSKGSMFVEGRIARFVYISLYRMHQVAIHGLLKASTVMLAQKIGGAVKPKIKLH